jgi:2-methylcitrate dehydratase PrpD
MSAIPPSVRPILPVPGTMKHGPIEFIRDLQFGDLPGEVAATAQLCVLDLIGVACGGVGTRLSRIVRDHAVESFGGGRKTARLLFDGRRVSAAGAALANGMTIDAFDAHDGHVLTKGHAGAAVLPAALAFAETCGKPISGRDLLTDVVIGYEIAIRAGIATHGTACDYHTSGSWNALGAAAIGARRLDLDPERTRHALGIAEYHGPRSQMMRCIDHPTMVKDGSGWGAMTGVSAAQLAAAGFTGAPALVVEGTDVADLWADFGRRWRLLEIYFKPYPICRWAQPAVEAALSLVRANALQAEDVERVEVLTFHQAARLSTRAPRSTEEAQYSLPFPVAAAIARRQLTASEVAEAAFADPEIVRLSSTMVLSERADFNARFPAKRYAQVILTLRDGRRLTSSDMPARGDPDTPLGRSELVDKFRTLVDAAVGSRHRESIEEAIAGLPGGDTSIARLLDLITSRG